MKRNDDIIYEKYGGFSGFWNKTKWTAEECENVLKKDILKDCLKKSEYCVEKLENIFVPLQWFSFTKTFTKIDENSVKLIGDASSLSTTFKWNSHEMEMDEVRKFLYGDESDKEFGGIAYNVNLRDELKEIGIKLPKNGDDENEDEDEDTDDDYKESADVKLLYAYMKVINEAEDDSTDDYNDKADDEDTKDLKDDEKKNSSTEELPKITLTLKGECKLKHEVPQGSGKTADSTR